jgi:hypothetical protein
MESIDPGRSQNEEKPTDKQMTEHEVSQKDKESIIWVWGECSSVIKLGNTLCQECYEVEEEIIEQDHPTKNEFVLSDEQNEEINKLLTDEAR